MPGLQRALSLIYPDQCLLCPELVETSGGLCAACWKEMPFLRGLVCDACGAGLIGFGERAAAFCDECLVMPRPWARGRAVLSYRGAARQFVLALKHGDRPDLAGPAAAWMETAAGPLLGDGALIVPVPVHWTRLIRRRYNQSVELGRMLARRCGLDFCPDALVRVRRTQVQEGMGLDARFANLHGAIQTHLRRGRVLAGREVCLVDDVMTSGATLAAATDACIDAGAMRVSVLVLARVEKGH